MTRADRRATIALVVVGIGMIAGILAFSEFSFDNENQKDGTLSATTDSAKRTERNSDRTPTVNDRDYSTTLKAFDPNTVDSVTLVRMGLTSRQAHGWLRYREAGAVFREPMDITRLYVLSDDDIDRLLPLVKIDRKYANRRTKYPIRQHETGTEPAFADQRSSDVSRTEVGQKTRYDAELHSDKFNELTKINVNTADTTLLKRVPGIGSNIARWIVERRERLGGFHSLDQLMEVKHMNESLIKWFEVNPIEHKMINISTMSFTELSRFPYIGYDKAKAISNYIRIYGKFSSEQDIIASNIFTEEELAKLLPYCRF